MLAGIATLAASAVAVQLMTRKAEADHVPLGKKLMLDGHTLHLLDVGAGPCVVLLHGNGAMIEDFVATGLIDALAVNHRVIVFDRPGFGESSRPSGSWSPEREADLLAQALEMLDIRHPVVVGHSWGTMVALSLALRDQASIAGMVLMSGYYYPTTRLDVALQLPASLPVIGPLLRYTLLPLLARLNAPLSIKMMFSPKKVTEAFEEQYSKPMACRPSQLKAFSDDTVAMPGAAARLRGYYSELHVPVHIIAGDADKIVSTDDQSVPLARELHNSTLQVFEGVGHMSHHARPDLVMQAVERLHADAARIASAAE